MAAGSSAPELFASVIGTHTHTHTPIDTHTMFGVRAGSNWLPPLRRCLHHTW